MDYRFFTTRNFVKDVFFQQWVIRPDPETCLFWENWLRAHPQKAAEVAEARAVIQTLNFGPDLAANQAMIDVWEKIGAARRPEAAVGRLRPGFRPGIPLRVAALAGIILLAVLLYRLYLPHQAVSVATRYGETRTVRLPDGSEVVLNANSRLTYAAEWEARSAREVRLEGEAFFKVRERKGTGQEKFRVRTEVLTVEVLGTQFNVNNRRKRPRVVLNSGRVQLEIGSGGRRRALRMQPGELVEVSGQGDPIVRKNIDPELYTSWRNDQLRFDRTPLREIGILLEDNYGYQVVFRRPGLAHKRFSGVIPARNPELLLTTLTRLYGLTITRKNKQLLIDSGSP